MSYPRDTKFWQKQRDYLLPALRAALADPAIAARFGRTVELAAEACGIGDRVEVVPALERRVASLRLTPEDAASSLEKLCDLVRDHSDVVKHAWSANRLRQYLAVSVFAQLARALDVDPEHLRDGLPDRLDHLLPDNPLTLSGGAVAHTDAADMRHLQQLRDYWGSRRLEGKPGRPRGEQKTGGRRELDPEKAAQAYRMDSDGQPWAAIHERCLGPVPYERQARDAARHRTTRLIQRGRLNAQKSRR